VDQPTAVDLYLNASRLREFIAGASFAERVAAIREVRGFVSDARLTRDTAIAAAESALPDARAAVSTARQALAQAQTAESALTARIDHATQVFSATAGVVESRMLDCHTPAELAAAQAPADAVPADA
jgi:hypothetical protein